MCTLFTFLNIPIFKHLCDTLDFIILIYIFNHLIYISLAFQKPITYINSSSDKCNIFIIYLDGFHKKPRSLRLINYVIK